jgi:hypothetical protein
MAENMPFPNFAGYPDMVDFIAKHCKIHRSRIGLVVMEKDGYYSNVRSDDQFMIV